MFDLDHLNDLEAELQDLERRSRDLHDAFDRSSEDALHAREASHHVIQRAYVAIERSKELMKKSVRESA